MTKKELIEWSMKNPELLIKLINKLVTRAEFQLALDEIIKQRNRSHKNN